MPKQHSERVGTRQGGIGIDGTLLIFPDFPLLFHSKRYIWNKLFRAMANPIIPGIPQTEQDLLYSKLNAYNQGRASYKEVGAYLVVLPRPEHLQYTLWIYSPLPGRQSIFYICDLSTDIHETLRMASTLCFYSPRSLLLVEYNAKRMQSKGDDIISVGKYHGHFLHEILRIDPAYLTWIAFKFQPRIPKQ